MNHDICYTVNPLNKGDCDRTMVKDIDSMPYKDINKKAMIARTIINKKRQLGLRVNKNDTNKELADELHKRIIKKFTRRQVYSPDIDVML